MSLCHSDDYKYENYQYDEYHENYDYDNQKLEDYTDDYSQDYDYYTNQNLLASLNPPPTPRLPSSRSGKQHPSFRQKCRTMSKN